MSLCKKITCSLQGRDRSCRLAAIPPVSYAGITEQRRLCQFAGFSNVTCLDSYSLQESILFTRIIPDNVIARPFDALVLAGQVRYILDPHHD
ncbi:MAG: hypothetical protein PHF31_07410 [Methylobacter sp.]|nr:hypothetical protein [Methylobacter sp.]